MWNASTISVVLLFSSMTVLGQPQGTWIDGIIAVVGREAVLHSELVARAEGSAKEGGAIDRCRGLEDILYEKLLLEQGRIDSVVVDEAQVDAELDRRIRYFASQLGGETELEKFYGKTITEIRAEFREQVHDQLLVQTMQQKVTSDIRVTPRDVQRFFDRIPEDSVPFMNAEVEYAQILRIPKSGEEEERRVRRRIEELREGVAKGGKDMCTTAILYSEDPGSAKECGELGMVPLGTMVPEFDAVAMSLKEGEVSQVFKTQYGYHFMQMIERRGEHYNARHVLLRPQIGQAELNKERQLLEGLVARVRTGDAEFSALATEFSDDEESRATNGLVVEPSSNSSRWDISALDQQTFFVLDKLTVGAIGDPQLVVMPDGSKAYRVLRLLSRTAPHRANMKDDYRSIHQAAEGRMRTEAVDRWVKERLDATYIRISEDYSDCRFTHAWTTAQQVEEGHPHK